MHSGIRPCLGLGLVAVSLGTAALLWSSRQAAALSTLGRRYVFPSVGITPGDTIRVTAVNPVLNSATGSPNVRGTLHFTFFDADGRILQELDQQVVPGNTVWADLDGARLGISGRAQVRAEVTFRVITASPSPLPLALETPGLEVVDTASGRTVAISDNPKLIGGG